MDSFKSFLDSKVNLNEFQDIYNSYTDNKVNFGGGQISVKDLLTSVKFKKEGGKKSLKKKGGGDDVFDFTIPSSGPQDNFFHLTKPSGVFTNTNSLADMTPNFFSYPDTQKIERSFIF